MMEKIMKIVGSAIQRFCWARVKRDASEQQVVLDGSQVLTEPLEH
jgi:hypothetical protein